MNKVWETEHIDFIKTNAGVFNDTKLTQELNARFQTNFTMASVRKKRQRLAILKDGYRGYFKVRANDVAEN